jgi:hypothetical protein
MGLAVLSSSDKTVKVSGEVPIAVGVKKIVAMIPSPEKSEVPNIS